MTYEAWRPVAGFPGYEISDRGRVRSLARRNRQGAMRRERILKTDRTRTGYLLVRLARDGVKHAHTVHSLVLSAFRGSRPEGCQTRHLNGVRDDNRVENLQWGTQQENRADQKLHGTGIQGQRNPKARFTVVDAERISDLRRAGCSQQAVGDWLGISQTWVGKILRNGHWTQRAA